MREIYLALLLSITLYSVSVSASIVAVRGAYENLLSYQEARDNAQQILDAAQAVAASFPHPSSLPTCEILYCESVPYNDPFMPLFGIIFDGLCPVGTACPNMDPFSPALPCENCGFPYACEICQIVELAENAQLALTTAQNEYTIAAADLLIAQSIYDWYANLYDDNDADNIYDVIDNCLSTYNPAQEDFDNDTVGDACDIEQVSAMGGIGLLALGLSMLGLGAVRLRK